MYKFNRLSFSIKVAPAIFQQVMDTMLSGLDFGVAYLDNILLKSENLEEHKENIFKVFRRIQDHGFKLKDGKYEFFMDKIKYLGQIIDKTRKAGDDIQHDPVL